MKAPLEHPKIDEIVVVDDHSDDFDGLKSLLDSFPKVTLHRNDRNLKCFGNKIEAIARSTSEWVITCDSDNIMGIDYLDIVTSNAKLPSSWYCPTFARPLFDYRRVIGVWNASTIHTIAHDPCFCCFINTGNQTVRREDFVRVFSSYRGRALSSFMPDLAGVGRGYPDSIWDGNDSKIFNFVWLKSGGQLVAHCGLEYDHTVNDSEPGNYVLCARDPRCGEVGQVIDSLFTRVL